MPTETPRTEGPGPGSRPYAGRVFIAGFPAGAYGTNCYVVADAPCTACVVIDPGQESVAPLNDLLARHRLTPVAVLITHGHFDHTFSVAPVCDGHDIPAWVHPDDRELLADPLKGLSRDAQVAFFGGRMVLREPREVREMTDGTELDLAGLRLSVVHAPGHSPGSVLFGTQNDDGTPLMFSGDVLFAGSIGRTDLPGGNGRLMRDSLRTCILPRDDATVVLPGHGPTTTIGVERASNPFLRGLLTVAPRRGL